MFFDAVYYFLNYTDQILSPSKSIFPNFEFKGY